MQKIKPDVYLVGEVWSKAPDVAPYLKGLPALFNFDMGYTIASAVLLGKDTTNLVHQYKEIIDFYSKTNKDYIDATFLRNHDQNRIMSELADNSDKARSAAGILFTLPGTPYVYYGEEIGMKGMKPDEYIREPFIWGKGDEDPNQTKWETPRYSTDQTVAPLSTQRADPHSLFSFYRKFISYRNSSDILTYGSVEETPLGLSEVVSLIRVYKEQKVLALHNISDVEVTVDLAGDLEVFKKVDFSTAEPKWDGTHLTLRPYSCVILK
jgi:glycosidase